MSRWWKIVIAIAIMLPLLIIGAGLGFIAKTFGWPTAQKFLAGTFRGTRSRPLTARTFERTPARLVRGRYLVPAWPTASNATLNMSPVASPYPRIWAPEQLRPSQGSGCKSLFQISHPTWKQVRAPGPTTCSRGQFAKA